MASIDIAEVTGNVVKRRDDTPQVVIVGAGFGGLTAGFLAWLAWLTVHFFFLVGFRNRISVFLNWAWSYVTYRRGARLITGRVGEPAEAAAGEGTPHRPARPS